MFTVHARMREVTDTRRTKYPSFLKTKPTSTRVGNGWYWIHRDRLPTPDPENPQFTDRPLQFILDKVVADINASFNVRVVSSEGHVVWQRHPD